MRIRKFRTWTMLSALALVACGQEPAFKNLQSQDSGTKGSGSGGYVDEGGHSIDPPGEGPEGEKNADITKPGDDLANNGGGTGSGGGGSSSGGGNGGGSGGGGGNSGGGGTTPNGDIVFPDIDKDSDKEDLKKCLAAWGSTPFAGPTSVRKIFASVTVGGFGVGIDDRVQTANPELVIVYAGVNVGGSVNYNMLNRNAYYCMVANVNVVTRLNVNLHCNARLADAKVAVNIGGQQNGSTAAVGVNVGSEVTIQNVRPDGEQCVR